MYILKIPNIYFLGSAEYKAIDIISFDRDEETKFYLLEEGNFIKNSLINCFLEDEKDIEADTIREVSQSKEKAFYDYFGFISDIKVKTMLVFYFDYECDLTNDVRSYFPKILDTLASSQVVIDYEVVIGKSDLWFFLGILIKDTNVSQISFYSNKKPMIPPRVHKYLKDQDQGPHLKCYKLSCKAHVIPK